jgi:hypothetical protein
VFGEQIFTNIGDAQGLCEKSLRSFHGDVN